MTKTLRVINLVIPVTAATVTGVAPLAVYGAEQAYKANHFDLQVIGEVSVTNPHVVLGHDYSTKVEPLDPTHEIISVSIYTTRILTEEEYTFDPATGDLWIARDYITTQTLLLIANTEERGTLDFTGESEQTQAMNEFPYVFTYTGKHLPERNIVRVSIVQTSGEEKIVHSDGDDNYALELDAQGNYIVSVDLKFDDNIKSTATFNLYCFYTSAISGKEIEFAFSGFKATYE